MERINCDLCGCDLSITGNCMDWRVLVKSEAISPEVGAAVTDMWIDPPVAKNAHFCGLGCLQRWLEGIASENEKDISKSSS